MRPARAGDRILDAVPDDLVVLTSDDRSLVMLSFSLPPQDEHGTTPVSSAEAEVIRCIVRGMSNKMIASERGTSVRTVANQVASIFRKLGVSSRRELVTSGAWLRGGVGVPRREP